MENRWTLPFTATPRLELRFASAALRMEGTLAGEAPSLTLEGGSRDAPLPRVVLEGDTVRVDAAPGEGAVSAPPFWTGGVRGVLRLRVPQNLQARIRIDFGRVHVEGLNGCDLEVVAGAGAISLHRVQGRLRVHSHAGAISGTNIGGTLDIRTNAGSVKLIVTALAEGPHRVHSSMGAVKLFLQPGLDVRIEADTNMGSVRTRYPSRADAPTVLMLHADLGSVKVATADPNDKFDDDPGRGWEEAEPRHPLENALSWAARFAARWGEGFAPPRPPPFAPGVTTDYAPPPPAPPARVSDEELRRVLALVEAGKITAQDAEQLLKAMER